MSGFDDNDDVDLFIWGFTSLSTLQFVRVLYYKLPTNGKQLPAFPLEAVPGISLRGGRRECYHSATVAHHDDVEDSGIMLLDGKLIKY